MANIRIERLNHTYQEEISMILMEEVKDVDAKKAIITGVKVTNDLSYATVYFTVYDKEEKDIVIDALKNAASFIRACLADRIEIRHTPELRFVYDTSEEYGEHIDKIIKDINDKK